MTGHRYAAVLILMVVASVGDALGQGAADPSTLLSAQREAMTRLAFMDGVWRGTGWTMLPTGQRHTVIQTERVGPFLDGSVRVVEGRGYGEDGSLSFNAFGIISFDPATGTYALRSYAQGRRGDFVLTPAATGFTWEIPAGPATIRYTATFKEGTWHEVGDRLAPGQEPVRILEMNLERVGDTDWPAAGPIHPE